jgi:hypothetical protein
MRGGETGGDRETLLLPSRRDAGASREETKNIYFRKYKKHEKRPVRFSGRFSSSARSFDGGLLWFGEPPRRTDQRCGRMICARPARRRVGLTTRSPGGWGLVPRVPCAHPGGARVRPARGLLRLGVGFVDVGASRSPFARGVRGLRHAGGIAVGVIARGFCDLVVARCRPRRRPGPPRRRRRSRARRRSRSGR